MSLRPLVLTASLLALTACDASSAATPEADPAPAAENAADAASDATPDAPPATITVYSGRKESLVGDLIKLYEETTGGKAEVRYGKTAEMAATLLEEGDASPADVFFAQDAGGLGAVSAGGMLAALPDDIVSASPKRFRSETNDWVGISGRARVVAYSTERVKPEDLPESILGFTDPKWKGRIGWPPTNGSFQAFVTALRQRLGEDGAKAWLEGILANEPKVYPKNTPTVKAVADGEIDVGFVNHYYLFRFIAEEGEGFPVRNHYMPKDDIGNLINVAGVGIVRTTKNRAAAEGFVKFLQSDAAQTYFAEKTYEYPLREGVPTHPILKPLSEIDTPDVDLNQLDDLRKTLDLLREVGALD